MKARTAPPRTIRGGEDNEPSGVVEAESFEVSFHVLSCFGLVGWRSCFPGMGLRSWGGIIALGGLGATFPDSFQLGGSRRDEGFTGPLVVDVLEEAGNGRGLADSVKFGSRSGKQHLPEVELFLCCTFGQCG